MAPGGMAWSGKTMLRTTLLLIWIEGIPAQVTRASASPHSPPAACKRLLASYSHPTVLTHQEALRTLSAKFLRSAYSSFGGLP